MYNVAATRSGAGLSSGEAARRHRAGMGNTTSERSTRSFGSIIKANLATRFNVIITSLTVVVLIFGSPIDALFAVVMVLNSLIGIVQEVRAKRSLDALRVLVAPTIGVRRDGHVRRVDPTELVIGDVLELEVGDQVPVDGVILSSDGLEVDEAALTGESEPVGKPAGSEMLSGSFVVAGSATAEATRVGADSWAAQLTREAKDFALTDSELRVGINRLLGVIGWLLPPLSALLLWSQLRSAASLADGMIATVAGVVSLVPQGLVLLVSMAMAVAVIRLAENMVVVQELPAVEGLARVDVLCVDKTGTLTTGNLTVDRLEPLDHHDGVAGELRAGLAALVELETVRTATAEAIRIAVVDDDPAWTVLRAVPFSSVRKWSGVEFAATGTWILGAPEILLDAMSDPPAGRVRARVDELTSQARRVLLVAHSEQPLVDERLPVDLRPLGLVSLKEEVRPDAAETMSYFAGQNVDVKVISGDNPRTVAAVAAELGIGDAGSYVDMRTIDDVDDIPPDAAVFGRVLPEQKRDLVRALQSRGHTVAMTGDGVNDIPSLKAADIGIAMNTASPATKATAQLVLLDGRFDRLPDVVAEGRRVIANMERVSSLFVTKTVYAALLVLVIGAASVPFPFVPRHLSLVAALTIGIPGFLLSFRPASEPCRPGYLRRVMRFAVPAGFVATIATLGAYWAARSPLADADLDQARTAATIALTLTGFWVLYLLARPLDRTTRWMFTGLVGTLVAAVAPASPLSEFYALRLPPWRTTAVIVGVVVAMFGLLNLLLGVAGRVDWNRLRVRRTRVEEPPP